MMSNHERLIYMANQIARNFEALGPERAVAATADHIASFWDPRMKEQIYAVAGLAEGGLTSIASAAIVVLRTSGAPAPQTQATDFGDVNQMGGSDAG